MSSTYCRHAFARSGTMATSVQTKERVNEMLQQMELPQHAQQALVSSTIRMIEKYQLMERYARAAKRRLQLLYVLDIKGGKEVQRSRESSCSDKKPVFFKTLMDVMARLCLSLKKSTAKG
ncbi:MAG: hypothetical protein WKG06_38375 [Segetibacter sp.]